MPKHQRAAAAAPAPPKLRNYTTEVPAQTSIDGIKRLLRRAGAREIAETWDADGATTGIRFVMDGGPLDGQLEYRLPARVDRVYARLQREYKAGQLPGISSTQVTRERAADITWRTLALWLEAQLDLILTGLTQLQEVMLPYQLIDGDNGRVSIYEYSAGLGLLPAPRPEEAG